MKNRLSTVENTINSKKIFREKYFLLVHLVFLHQIQRVFELSTFNLTAVATKYQFINMYLNVLRYN